MPDKLLIVNADDFGAHEDVNHGIIRAHQHGIVKSTSLMINMPAAEHAIELARSFPSLEVGLHLNVTSGSCISMPSEVSLLAGSDRKFFFDEKDVPGSLHHLRKAVGPGLPLIDQISLEIRRQVERFEQTGLRLSHINSHHYVSLLHPQLFEAHLRIAEAKGVALRGLCYPMIDLLSIPPADIRRMKGLIGESLIPLPGLSISNLWDGKMHRPSDQDYRKPMEETLAELVGREDLQSIEIITHPALMTPTLRNNDDYIWARELETSLILCEEFHTTVKGMGYWIGGYDDLNGKSIEA